MAWPPPTLPTTRSNTTIMGDTHPADHNAANLAINDIVAYVKPGPWTTLTLTNGWVIVGGGYYPLQYRIVGDMVQLRGSVKSGSVGAAIATLPAGARPPAGTVSAPVQAWHSTPGPMPAYVEISGTGAIIPTITGTFTYISLLFAFSVTA